MKKQEDTFIAADGRKFKRVEYAFQGDYCGSTVERSNAEWLQEHYRKTTESLCERAYGDEENEYEEPDPATLLLEEYLDYHSCQLYALETEEDRENNTDEYLKRWELQETIDALSGYPLIDDEHLSRLEDRLLEEYLEQEIPSACRSLRCTLKTQALSPEVLDSWEEWADNLSDKETEAFQSAMLDRFPRYRESSGECVAIFETGCTVYIRGFDNLFSDTFFAWIDETGQNEAVS